MNQAKTVVISKGTTWIDGVPVKMEQVVHHIPAGKNKKGKKILRSFTEHRRADRKG